MKAIVVISLLTTTLLGDLTCRNQTQPTPKDNASVTKLKELESLPVGITVTHDPNPASAIKDGPSRMTYTWVYKTTVMAKDCDVSITEFGCFAWYNGAWKLSNSTGQPRPFTAKQFAEWYSCPDAKLTKGQGYSDPSNWGGNRVLEAGKSRWYFIGLTPDGRKVKGEAIATQLAQLKQD